MGASLAERFHSYPYQDHLLAGIRGTDQKIFKKNGLEYPAGYKLLAVGGGNLNLAALTSGQVSAAFLVVPLVYAAEEQGFKNLGFYKDYFPNYQLTVMAVKRGWAERNRTLMVRFLKGRCAPTVGSLPIKSQRVDFLSREIQITPELARKGWDYYTSNRIWHPNAELNLEGMKFALEIFAEQAKIAAPDPLKYVDHSYLQQTLKN